MNLRLHTSGFDKSDSWRLGPDEDPGWFVIDGADRKQGVFSLVTLFRLDWDLTAKSLPDGIHNMLHAVTIGRDGEPGKTHIEQLVQIFNGDLHITCRSIDHSGQTYRHTVALPGHWQQYQNRDLLLLYTADPNSLEPTWLTTTNVL